jgi:hypothetical protein
LSICQIRLDDNRNIRDIIGDREIGNQIVTNYKRIFTEATTTTKEMHCHKLAENFDKKYKHITKLSQTMLNQDRKEDG